MKKILYITLCLLLVLFILNGCGSSSNISPVLPTATPGGGTDKSTEEVSQNTDYASVVAEDVLITQYLDYSNVLDANSAGSSSAITAPPTPSGPPTVPSGNYAYKKTTTLLPYGLSTIDWYIYLLPKPWSEWKTELKPDGNTVIGTLYGSISQPTSVTDTTVSRTFTVSGWSVPAKLVVYTTGSLSYITADPNNFSFTGTQQLFLPSSTLICSFDTTRKSSGGNINFDGTLTFDNGSATFSRTVNPSAINTGNTYASTSGTMTLTIASLKSNITFSQIQKGDGSITVVVTADGASRTAKTTLNYKSDGSGTGLVELTGPTGIPSSINLVWNSTGAGTATFTIGSVQKTVSIYVPQPFSPYLTQ